MFDHWFMDFFVLSLTLVFQFFVIYQLEEHDYEGQCNSECKTIERACQEVCLHFLFYFSLCLVKNSELQICNPVD